MTEPDASRPDGPPTTGNREIDQALARLVALDDTDVQQHHALLAQAQDVLGSVLEDSRGGQQRIPQAMRPTVQHG